MANLLALFVVLLLAHLALARSDLLPLLDSAPNSTTACSRKLVQMLNQFYTDPSLATTFAYSGKGMNDIGDYINCKQTSTHRYMLVSIFFGGMFMFRLGLCPPAECTAEFMQTYARPYLASLASMLTHARIRPEQVSVEDTVQANEALRGEAETGEIILLAVVAALAAICVVCAVAGVRPNNFWGSFNLRTNMRSLMSTENRLDPKLEVLNGIRVLSMAWVVSGHSFFLVFFRAIYNSRDYLNDVVNEYYMTFVKSATLAVDVFLFLSGFLAALGTSRAFSSGHLSWKAVGLAYFHRYVRLLPLLGFGIAYSLPKCRPCATAGPGTSLWTCNSSC